MDGRTFEDFAFEVLSRVSPVKLPRDNIPFDSVREIILSELNYGKKKSGSPESEVIHRRLQIGRKRKSTFEEMDEDVTSTSSSSHFEHDEKVVSTSSNTDYKGSDEEARVVSKTMSARFLGSKTNGSHTLMHHASSAPALCSMDERKKPMTHREKRMVEMRQARIKRYRGDSEEVLEFKCDESSLAEALTEHYSNLLNDPMINVPCGFFQLIDSLENYFRVRTWDSNCTKVCFEFLRDSIYRSCQQLNEAHEAKDLSDEMRVKELQFQVLVGLQLFNFQNEKVFLDDAIHKLRLIYIAADPQRMKSFLEEPVTDIFVDQIGESIANIYDELCIALPADLAQFDANSFKMLENDDNLGIGKRRNGNALKLEQMLAETFGESEKSNGSEQQQQNQQNNQRKKFKRRSEIEKLMEDSSPSKRLASEKARETSKRFFVEETPDEKCSTIQEELVGEELDEVVQQTPMAKLRMAANKNGRRCSKRLSDLVKYSEERSTIPRKAKENVDKLLEKAKVNTPLRSTRQTPRSVLFANNSPSPLTIGKSRLSLQTRFSSCQSKASTSSTSTPLAADRRMSLRSNGTGTNGHVNEKKPNGLFQNGHISAKRETRVRLCVKRESPDDDEGMEVENNGKSDVVTKAKKEWSDRKLRSQLGLTRDDLNRYRDAMLAMGMKKEKKTGNSERNWETRQVNRAGRVKGGGSAGEEDAVALFGVKRREIKTFMCHVLLNDSNPDMSFDWSKVNFGVLDDIPRTRSVQNLIARPQQLLETLKRKYIESKTNPSSPVTSSSSPLAKKAKMSPNGSMVAKKKISLAPRKSRFLPKGEKARKSLIKTEVELDEYGLEEEME